MKNLPTHNLSLDKLHMLALDNALSIVTYRLPGAKEAITMLQWKDTPAKIDNIESLDSLSGFVFAPFDFDSGSPARIIQPDLILYKNKYIEIEKHNTGNPLSEKIIHDFVYSDTHTYVTTRQEFMAQVEQIKQLIERKTIQKVVLSRISREEKPENFEPAAFFKLMESLYPDAFVFTIYIPDAGLWLGASPEPLLLADHGWVSTVSLAGTRAISEENPDREWNSKEIHEQSIVTDYISDIFEKLEIKKFIKKGPHTHPAGKIEHLKTMFSFSIDELNVNLSELLKELHPTPSVCGLPKDISMQIIKNTEKHRRDYYTGFLGPVNFENQWNLFVNLRSMRARGSFLEYYLGAGITAGSIPEDEWEETNKKMNTLKSLVESLKENNRHVVDTQGN